jgi:hypothetical protein
MASIEERLEAIARNLELLSGMQLKTEEALNRLTDTVNTGFTKVERILDPRRTTRRSRRETAVSWPPRV